MPGNARVRIWLRLAPHISGIHVAVTVVIKTIIANLCRAGTDGGIEIIAITD
jgi:hypothetical protein